MFDISWQDPETETVRQRKSRKEQQNVSRPESSVSSKSSDTSTRKQRPSVLTLFHRSKREFGPPESRSTRSISRTHEPSGPVPGAFRDVLEPALPDDGFPPGTLAARMPMTSFYLDDVPSSSADVPSSSADAPSSLARASYTSLDGNRCLGV
jgi:hypothetical protein